MNIRKGTLIALLLISMSQAGCGLVYASRRAELLKTASVEDYGPPPPGDYLQQEEEFIRAVLKDPDSAKFVWGDAKREVIQSGFGSPTPVLVWVNSVHVNAKNSFGGYTGRQPYYFAWKDGELFAVAPPFVSGARVSAGMWRYLK